VPRTIKRYANRKLYDTEQSKYVTLGDIADFVRLGEEVRVVDNTTKEDLTEVTLAQILFEAEKNNKSVLPLATLRSLIQSGGEFFEKTITRPVVNIRNETERRVTAARDAIHRTEDDARDRFTTFVETTQRSVDDFQKRVDERFHGIMTSVSKMNRHQDEIGQLRTVIERLEVRIAVLEKSANEGGQ
jgi:polyhydroxyalkanoate synthesis repressor PhaR